MSGLIRHHVHTWITWLPPVLQAGPHYLACERCKTRIRHEVYDIEAVRHLVARWRRFVTTHGLC